MDEYCVVEDISFIRNKNKFYISSDTVGVYLKVNEKIYILLQTIVSNINDNKCSNVSNETVLVNYQNGFEFLKKYNLVYLKREGIQKKNALETEIIGKKIKVFFLKQYKKSAILQLILLSILISGGVIFIINIYSFFNTNLFDELVEGYNHYDVTLIKSIISIIFAIFISLFIHESFHIMFANLFNVTVRSISFYLLLGFQPVMFVKYRGLLKIDKTKKILIYCAGFIGNLLTANISFLLLGIYKNAIFGVIVIVNLFMILDNMSIINNTDLYYVITELFNKTNFKVNIIRSLGKVFTKEITIKNYIFNKDNIYKNIYLMLGIIYRVASIFLFIYFIVSCIVKSEYQICISIVLVVMYVIINIKKVIKNIKTAAIG